MIQKSLLKILWARIAAATLIHGVLSAIVFEACSFSMVSVKEMGPPSFTLLRLGKTLMVVIAQCTPIFIRLVMGQTMDSRRWGLLRVDSVSRAGFQARIYLAQFITSSFAAAVFAINLIRAVDQNASYRVSLDGKKGSGTTNELYNWWHVEFILLSALAAVVADTVRSIRVAEHELTFPMLRNDPELIAPLLSTHLPRLIISASISSLQWMFLAFTTVHFIFPLLSKLTLHVAQFGFGSVLGIPTVPAVWSLLDDVASRHWSLFTPPFAIVWRAFVTYTANYLLLSHGVESLKRILSTPIDFNRIAGYQPGDGPGYSPSSYDSNTERPLLGKNGQPVSSLLIETMSIGWHKALASGEDSMTQPDGSSRVIVAATPSSLNTDSKPRWMVELDSQRLRMEHIRGRLLDREVLDMRSGGKGFTPACTRLWRDFLACGEFGVHRGTAMPLKVPRWNEQDSDTLMDLVARALAMQNAAESMMTGGRIRRDIYQNYWSQFSSICCLNIDNATLQFQTFVADKQRRRVEEEDGMLSSDLGDLFHESGNRSTEWGACGLIKELAAEKAIIRSHKYDKIAARIAVGILRFIPKILQKAGGLLKAPLPPRLPAPATQILLWSIEALSRGLALATWDEFGDARSSVPVALYSLIGLQLALEAVNSEYKLNRLQGRGGHQQILPEYESLSIVLDTSLSLVVRNMKDALPAFSFPPKYASRLRHYVALNS